MDANAIDNVKASLMGPLAGLGDSFFWGTLRLSARMCGTLNTSRNRIGPRILPFSARLVPIPVAIRYVLGTGVLQRIQKSGMMESLTYGASIIGLMVVGA
jgi:fructoselysine and glucoselysine-specific PTS system IID component